MREKTINLKKTESLLKELLPEAISTLNDDRINSISITDVDCKKGKYDAIVYFDGSDYDNAELKIIRELLKKASSRIKAHCLNATGWYKCPDFKFVADNNIEKSKRIEKLFEELSSMLFFCFFDWKNKSTVFSKFF